MLRIIMFAVAILFPVSTLAQSPTEALTTCVTDNTNGKDRKDLVRWAFFGIAAHPELQRYTSDALAANRDSADQHMAEIFMRLLTKSCAAEAKHALAQGGSTAISVAFDALGRIAMQELMANQDVIRSTSKFEQHLDRAKLSEALTSK